VTDVDPEVTLEELVDLVHRLRDFKPDPESGESPESLISEIIGVAMNLEDWLERDGYFPHR
jgi:hypothetical protein